MTIRLEPADYPYWFVRRAFGWSVVLQIAWRLPAPVSRDALAAFGAQLGRGTLNRRLVDATVPFARPAWVRAAEHPQPTIDADAVPADAVEAWLADELRTAPLDPERGPAWQLRGADTTDGGFVVSLTALHLVADGRAMVGAAITALSGAGSDDIDTPTRLADALDGVGQIVSVITGIGKAARAFGGAQPADARPAKSAAHVRAPNARYAWVTISVDAAEWRQIAERNGGTANTLFVAVLAGALHHAGYGPIKAGIPVSRRESGDRRANATAGVSVLLEPDDDLAAIRTKCKAAFTALSGGKRAPHVHLLPLVRLLPTGLVVKAATAGTGMPDLVASNLGGFEPGLRTIGGVTASAVAFRGIAQGVEPGLPYRFGDGIQSWCVETDGVLTFSVVAFDESVDLQPVLTKELDRWGVPHQVW